MKIGIDIGNYNVKTSKDVIFKSAISTTEQFNNNSDVLVLNGVTYYVGDGNLEIDFVKFKKDNYIPLLIASICKSMITMSNDIKLGVGLPLNQFKKHSEELKDMLLNKEFKGYFNGNKFSIRIISVNVFPEGVAGYIANYGKFSDIIDNRDVIVVDIGGKTTDIALIQNNKVVQNSTVSYGTIDIYNTIKLELEKKFTDIKVSIDKIEHYIKYGFYYKNKLTDIGFVIKKASNIYLDIYNELKLNYPINTEFIILSGGGSYLLGNIFKSKMSVEIDNDIFANARGYEKLLK